MVGVLRLRHWAQMMSTPQQLLLRARVDEGAMDEMDQAGTGTGTGHAVEEGVTWDKHPMTSVQTTLLGRLRLHRIAFERVSSLSSNSLFLNTTIIIVSQVIVVLPLYTLYCNY